MYYSFSFVSFPFSTKIIVGVQVSRLKEEKIVIAIHLKGGVQVHVGLGGTAPFLKPFRGPGHGVQL